VKLLTKRHGSAGITPVKSLNKKTIMYQVHINILEPFTMSFSKYLTTFVFIEKYKAVQFVKAYNEDLMNANVSSLIGRDANNLEELMKVLSEEIEYEEPLHNKKVKEDDKI